MSKITSGHPPITLIELSQSEPLRIANIDRIHSVSDPAYQHTYTPLKCFLASIYERKEYECHLPVIDQFDAGAVYLYTCGNGDYLSTLRVCVDGDAGLPITAFAPEHYAWSKYYGLKVGEPGRLGSICNDSGVFSMYVRAVYALAQYFTLDGFYLQVRADARNFYMKRCGAVEITSDKTLPGCINLYWSIANTPAPFKFRFGGDTTSFHERLTMAGVLR